MEISKKILRYAELLKIYLKDQEGMGTFACANAISEHAKEILKIHGAK